MARREVWHQVQFNDQAAYALQAMARGDATEPQQKMVLDWLIREACQTYDEMFTTEERVTDYLLGRRSVGRAIVNHLQMNMVKLVNAKET